MTRELKLALILGSSLVLVVGVLISDHLSGARHARIERVDSPLVTQPITQMPQLAPGPQNDPSALASAPQQLVYPTDDPAGRPPTGALADPVALTNASSELPAQDLADMVEFAKRHGLVLEPMPTAAQTDTVQRDENIPVIEMRDARLLTPADTAPPTSVPGAGTTEYTIQPGDTLWKLAERFMGSGSRHAELAALNKGRLGAGGELRLGTKIIVPASAGASVKSSTPTATQRDSAPSASPRNGKASKTYTVQAGDTLRKIARKTLGSEGRWQDIYNANRSVVKDSNTLRVGAVLQIPG
jgi:nucleoid-associated protein YgaU